MRTPMCRPWHFHSVQNSSSTKAETIQVCTALFSYFTSYSLQCTTDTVTSVTKAEQPNTAFTPIRYFQHVQGCVNKSANLWCKLKWTLTYGENPKSLTASVNGSKQKRKKNILPVSPETEKYWHRISDPQVALLGHPLSHRGHKEEPSHE